MLSQLIIHPEIDQQVQSIDSILGNLSMPHNHPDLLWVEPQDAESSLGVKDAKKVREHFHLKPYSAKGRVVVIWQSDRLTLDAQNSLLKTLEEAPTEALLILTAKSEQELLPTVISRCQIINVLSLGRLTNKDKLQKWSNTLDELMASTTTQKFQIIEKTEDKDEMFEALIVYVHEKLRADSKWLEFSKLLIKAKEYKEANGNIRAILEYLMLDLNN